jgi:hypothetical protein
MYTGLEERGHPWTKYNVGGLSSLEKFIKKRPYSLIPVLCTVIKKEESKL